MAKGEMRRRGFVVLVSVAAAWVVLAVSCARTPHYDATGRIGVLCIGDTSYGESPVLTWLSYDFSVQYQELPTDVQGVMTDTEARKLTRIYTPRNIESLVRTYDFLLFLEPKVRWFSAGEMQMFRTAVQEKGVATLLTMWPDPGGYDEFVNSVVSEVYPQEFAPSHEPSQCDPFRVILNRQVPPVLTMLLDVGIEGFTGRNAKPIHPKAGSKTWAQAKQLIIKLPWERPWEEKVATETPYIVSWEYGDRRAETWVAGTDVDEPWWDMRGGNDYGGDVILNILYYSVGKPLPPSILEIHNLRAAFFQYSIEKRLLYALVDFIDLFGAKTYALEKKIQDEADRGRTKAEKAYMEGDYEGSHEEISAMIEMLHQLQEEAGELKERALFWVYITEWSAVTGTGAATGLGIYMLMVRRRLYREVPVTRAAH